MTIFWRYLKAQVGWSWLLPPAIAAVMLAYLFITHRGDRPRFTEDMASLFEFFLPLAAAIYLAGAPVFDREEGAAEVHLSYPRWPSLRLVLTVLPRAVLWAVMALGLALVLDRWYLADQWRTLWAMLRPPALALSGAAVAGAALTRSQVGGVMAAFLWWALDAIISPGKVHSWAYLFQWSRAVPGLPTERVLLSLWLAGAVLWLVALLLAHRRERWVR